MPPPKLAPRFQRLPPILHKQARNSLPSYSKGAQGLSVLPRVDRICTANTISLSFRSRQCGSRYAFRAGRNLPDKELRYLRTVRVVTLITPHFLESAGRIVLSDYLPMSPQGSDYIIPIQWNRIQRIVSEDS